jgi:hypothetical protein
MLINRKEARKPRRQVNIGQSVPECHLVEPAETVIALMFIIQGPDKAWKLYLHMEE